MSAISDLIKRPGSRGGRAVWGAGVAMTLLVACTPSSEASGDVGKGPAPAGSIELSIDDSVFDPEVLEAPAGEEVTVEVTNADESVHDFAIESIDLNTGTIEAGTSAYATFTMPDQPIEFVCTFHRGMEGRIEPQ